MHDVKEIIVLQVYLDGDTLELKNHTYPILLAIGIEN